MKAQRIVNDDHAELLKKAERKEKGQKQPPSKNAGSKK